MSASERFSLEAVNGMGFAEFTEVFGSVVEHTPLVAAAVWSSRPFADLSSIHAAFTDFIRALPAEAQAGVLRCYPDLAGKLADLSELSRSSQDEHKAAGLLQLSEDEAREMTRLNNCYKEKFNFPFVICALENKKEAIVKGMHARMGNELSDEVRNGVDEVCKIALHRLESILQESIEHTPKL